MNMLKIEKDAKSKGFKIIWDDSVVGARSKNIIYLNPNLLKHKKYLQETLDHEYRHTGKFTLKDLGMDLFEGSLSETIKFSFLYPKTLRRMIPIWHEKNNWQVDVNLIIQYMIILTLSILLLWLMTK